jgi:hypothetical protein
MKHRQSLLSAILTLSVLAALLLIAPLATAAVPNTPITAQDLLKGTAPSGLVANSSFMPSKDAMPAHEAFVGRLHLAAAKMGTDPDPLTSGIVFGKDPGFFPKATIGFFTDGGNLVPATQDVIRAGSLAAGISYWDIIVQPGRVWSEPGENGWSRASFPFAFMHEMEGETHTGIATFLYEGDRVSHVRFQIVQQTSPYYIVDYFSAWGMTSASFTPGVSNLTSLRATWRASQAHRFPSATWASLETLVGTATLDGFDGLIDPADVVDSALVYKGVLYRKACTTAAGPFPYTDQMRFGVWSQTKSMALGIALLRLAHKYGPGILDEHVVKYVPEAAFFPGWTDVTFNDMANMASGHGFDSYLGGNYADWYQAPSEGMKLAEVLEIPVFAWAPGTTFRYRDQDAFLWGVAMERYLQAREGPKADIWRMVANEVYRPIGIYYTPMCRTLENATRTLGHAIMLEGYFPTLSDEARVAQLLEQRGRWEGKQLLYRPMVDELLPSTTPHGLPSDKPDKYYLHNFWINPYTPQGGSLMYFGTFVGWGGNLTVLMPKGMTGIRIAKVWDSALDYENPVGMLTVGDRLGAFAP